MGRLRIVIALAFAACGSASQPPPPAPESAPPVAIAPIDAAVIDAVVVPPDAAPVVDAAVVPPDADTRAAVAATIGLDLRALPVDSDAGQIDLFVLGQGDDVRDLAPAGIGVEIRHFPSTGILIPVFRADTHGAALRACRATIKAYLAQAPTMPQDHERSAARLVEPCARWIEP